MRVLVTGAAGSGTSTLAAALAARWDAVVVEADDFYWQPTHPPYQVRREPVQRDALFAQHLGRLGRAVVAGSVVGWGADGLFDLVVFLYVDAQVRLERLRAREQARFGAADPRFLEWAAQYDAGPPVGRSLARHEAWLASLACPVVRLTGDWPVGELVARIAGEPERRS